jgi:hypothetical protein
MGSNSGDATAVEATLYVDVEQDWYHTSYIFTGLALLARRGAVDLKIRHPSPADWRKSAPGNAIAHLDLQLRGRDERLPVCFDLADRSDVFFRNVLQACQVYFKRSYYRPDVEQLQPEYQEKVLPFGMNYACADAASWLVVARGVAAHLCGEKGRTLWNRTRLRRTAKALVRYSRLSRPEEFEHPVEVPKDPFVIFQPRLWEERHVRGENVEAVNESRAAVVRLLRRALGKRFRGGLVPTPLARHRYPDLITDVPPRRYAKHVRSALVAVSTRGLHFSTPWKLAEYLAATACVVGEPIRNELPRPLEPGHHYLPFTSPEECVDQCVRILDDPNLQRRLRNAAHEYYRSQVEPGTHFRNCIEAAAQA